MYDLCDRLIASRIDRNSSCSRLFTAKHVKLLKNIAIVSLFILMIDGCVYRDPYVRLSHGYEILAISPSSPCSLQYGSSNDDRRSSDFAAVSSINPETKEATFRLLNQTDVLTFTDEAQWREAIREHKASPDTFALQLENVTSFAADDDHIIGEFGDGHYLVDIAANHLNTYTSVSKWRAAVSESTELSSVKLIDPKSFFAKTRHPVALVVYVSLILVAIIMSRPTEPQNQ